MALTRAPASGALALGAAVFAVLVAVPGVARADDVPASGSASVLRFVERPHTVALLEAGVIALPNAPISQSQRGGAVPLVGPIGKGDSTIQMGIHIQFRVARDWAFGARFLLDPNPTADPEYGLGGLGALPRTHSRSYFTFGGEARYIPLHSRFFEGWVGAMLGGVIIADRFSTDVGELKPKVFGDRVVTLSTEGFYLGAQVGADWIVSDKVLVGLVFRGSHWFLPTTPNCSPIGDCATLTGSTDAIEFGVTVGYRIPL